MCSGVINRTLRGMCVDMKRLLLVSCMAFMSSLAGMCPPASIIYICQDKPINPFLNLFKAICEVETKSDSISYNKKERATGIAQIRPILITDYNQRTGARLRLSEMYNINKSKTVFLYYANKYEYYELEKIARKWNGRGPKTKIYWQRVKSILESD